MSEFYRLSFEAVAQGVLRLYCNADPILYKNVTQTVPNSQIPDEHWQPVSRETSDPWQQYHALKKHEETDLGFVRNVRLERQASRRAWEPFDPDALSSTPETSDS